MLKRIKKQFENPKNYMVDPFESDITCMYKRLPMKSNPTNCF